MPAATTPPTPLDPAKTTRHHNHRGRGVQTWAATSACGRYTYTRLDQTGTPWQIVDNTAGEELLHPRTGQAHWYATLRAARTVTAAVDAVAAASRAV